MLNIKNVPSSGDDYFATLRTCIVISVAILVAATLMHLPPLTAVVGGVIPLVFYHVGYLAPRAKLGLSQTAIDSVYYFGFLVTIAALGVSAIGLATSQGKLALEGVAHQFGLGLFATGYAVFARMHLASISRLVDDASPEAVLDKYIAKSRELVTNVEMASTRFADLAQSLMLKSEQVAETARLSTERSMLDVARAFDEQLRASLASGREGLSEIRGLVNETAFTQERAALVRGVKETLEAVTALNAGLADFARNSATGARTAESVAAASEKLNETLAAFDRTLGKVGGPEGSMVSSAQAIADAQSVVAEGTTKMARAVEELADVQATVSGMGLTFKNIKTLTLKANEQMQVLVENAERLDDASRHIARTAAASASLAEGLERTSAALPGLHEGVSGLDAKLASLSVRVGAVEKEIALLPDPVNTAVSVSGELKQALDSVRGMLTEAAAQAQALAGHTSSNAQSLQQAHSLSGGVEGLKATVATLEGLLAGLARRCEQMGTGLDSSTHSLKSAVDQATRSLESDVKRTTETAHLFAERLTGVAQHIIDRTRGSVPA